MVARSENLEFIHSDDIIVIMLKRSKAQIKSDVSDFLKRNRVMTLATYSSKGPWVSTAYYGLDKDMNLYFLTSLKSTQGTNISKNGKVAFNIFDSTQKFSDKKQGLQGFGVSEKMIGKIDIIIGAKFLFKFHPDLGKVIGVSDIINSVKNRTIYKITPKYLKYFDENYEDDVVDLIL